MAGPIRIVNRLPLIIFILFSSIAILPGWMFEAIANPKQMEAPLFWIRKVKNPDRLLLTLSEIQKMNEENLKRKDLFLCNLMDMKKEWGREEILAFLKEDWKGFGKTDQVRYGKQGTPLEDFFWKALKENIHQDALKEKNRLFFGFTVRRTDIRVFPTEELSMNIPGNYDFDLFQHSAIAPGSLVGIYYFSQDKLWAYVQTSFIRGWIRARDLAIAKGRSETIGQEGMKNRLVITGNFVKVFADPSSQQPVFSAQMGSTFPVFDLPQQINTVKSNYVIRIPLRENDGRLTFQNGYIPPREDVHYGFLPYTQSNLARQAFKMLHQPYGWGEMFGGRDCSRFIMDLFNTFGILMPRNSNLQAKMGTPLGPLEGKGVKEKEKILDRAVPFATLIRMPGHIMLYLGKHKGKHYVIHSIWGLQERGRSGFQTQKMGKVVVSDLSLGETGSGGSLLHRITEIQLIGPESETQKKH